QGYRSQHNSGYWSGVPYLGLGASAHSFDSVVRRANVSNTALYINKVLSGENAFEVEELTLQDRYNETIFTHLRTSDGVDLSIIEKQFGKENLQHLLREAASYIKDGYLKEVEGRVVLTRKGIVVSDSICCDLFL
ncbi:MAG: coproporphyrinogen III oxidase, partial [Coprobacter sp.]|nr:coproporphyrinogen III oxidase [Coprobacter sp.]